MKRGGNAADPAWWRAQAELHDQDAVNVYMYRRVTREAMDKHAADCRWWAKVARGIADEIERAGS